MSLAVQTFDSWKHRSGIRLAVMLAVGALTAVLVRSSGSWTYAPSLGWAAACLTCLACAWSVIGSPPDGTAAHAAREDSGRAASDALLLAATVASFGGVVLILLDAGTAEDAAKAGILAIALGGIALSWLLVNTLFTLRFAFLYYRDREGVDYWRPRSTWWRASFTELPRLKSRAETTAAGTSRTSVSFRQEDAHGGPDGNVYHPGPDSGAWNNSFWCNSWHAVIAGALSVADKVRVDGFALRFRLAHGHCQLRALMPV
jgi:hypothetical protein